MKNLLFLMIILVSCNTYNDKMNDLLERKAELESQYKVADSISADFSKRNTKMIDEINRKYLKEELSGVTKSSQWFKNWGDEIELKSESGNFISNKDSAEKYQKNSKILLKNLRSTEYSIDSLFKLK